MRSQAISLFFPYVQLSIILEKKYRIMLMDISAPAEYNYNIAMQIGIST